MKNQKSFFAARPALGAFLLLACILAIFFYRSFESGYVHFSNDGPLGEQNVNWLKLPGAFTGMWDDLNDVGFGTGTFSPNVTALFKWIAGPVGYSKFYAPFALLIVGLGAWTFFRALRFAPAACFLGALAAALNSAYLGNACWGVASGEIALGFNFFALALVLGSSPEMSRAQRGIRLALAGLCVGVNVMEGADVGALYSLVIAAFVFYKALAETDGSTATKISRGIGRVAVIAIFAGFLATQTIVALIGTSITGVAGTGQDAETKAAHWDGATEWSMPKKETLGLLMPGVFGYRMDTPNGMMPALEKSFQGGVYWGGIGRTPWVDRFLEANPDGTPQLGPGDMMRFSGGGNYCGILVVLVAAWTIAQSLRRQNSIFSVTQKKLIWFWGVVILISLPLAWGRFAPFSKNSGDFLFYALLYKLPYFSTIRNPCKFVLFICWALVILFGYGINALLLRQKEIAPANSFAAQLQNWWARAPKFDRRWIFGGGAALAGSVIGWLVYSSEKNDFIHYLQRVGFADETFANQIAGFSLGEVAWFIFLFIIAFALLAFFIAGCFSGKRAKTGIFLLGAFLIFDLGRADLPYIIHWDYNLKYDVDPANSANSINPIINFLRDKPYEHRVVGLPYEPQQALPNHYDNYFFGSGIYRIEWMQHHFPYYNIQCLDWIQMPREAQDLKDYVTALSPRGTPESVPLLFRRWELSNTRYLLGAAGFADALNQQLDPVQHRFRLAQRFDMVIKPGILQPSGLEDLTAAINPDGLLAVIEFTGALPRAKLFSNWQVQTNDQTVLKTLADLNFDPQKTVLVSTPQKDFPALSTNENSGSVEFQSYSTKKIILAANADAPSILLLNDKYDANWRVTVDGRRADLLRCNFLMRGVFVPPGKHAVEFSYALPSKPFYITLAAIAAGIFLSLALVFLSRKPQPSARK